MDKQQNYLPQQFDIAIGGCFGPSFTVRLVGDKISYEKSAGLYSLADSVEISPTAEQWARFWEQIDEIGVWQWSREYENPELEGAHWYIHMRSGERSVTSEGDTAFPGSCESAEPTEEFKRFLAALSELIGGREIW